jgi:hypothetical protein
MDYSVGVYGDYYHVYRGLYFSNIWNNYRGARFVIHEMVIGYLGKLHDSGNKPTPTPFLAEHSKLATQSETILKELSEEICASVPYHFGTAAAGSSSSSPGQYDPSGIRMQIQIDPHPAVAGYVLIWPLFLAADCKYSPPALKNWAIMSLEKIGHAMGISQALAMAGLLRDGMPSRSWNDRKIEMDGGPDGSSLSPEDGEGMHDY